MLGVEPWASSTMGRHRTTSCMAWAWEVVQDQLLCGCSGHLLPGPWLGQDKGHMLQHTAGLQGMSTYL